MAVTPTSLSTAITAGSTGAVANTNTVHTAVNALTHATSGVTVKGDLPYVDAYGNGVPNDGATNAQAAMATAMNLLPAAGGRLLLRRGSYVMNTRLTTARQGMVLEGEGPDATNLVLSSAAFQVGVSDVLIKNMTLKSADSSVKQLFQTVAAGTWKNWRFENVKFDNVQCIPSKLGAVTQGSAALTLAAGLTEHVEFDRCEFLNNQADGVLFVRGTDSVTVSRCWFHDLGLSNVQGDNLKFSYGATKWRALHNTFERSTRDAIDCYDGQQGLIEGNHIDTVGAFGIEIKVTALAATNPADRIQIIGNRIIAATGSAITTASSNIHASANTIEGGSSYGIRAAFTSTAQENNTNITWIGNQVKGCTNKGFSMVGINGAVIIGNTATDCGAVGYDIPISGGGINQNSNIVGGASLNRSSGNTGSDVWT